MDNRSSSTRFGLNGNTYTAECIKRPETNTEDDGIVFNGKKILFCDSLFNDRESSKREDLDLSPETQAYIDRVIEARRKNKTQNDFETVASDDNQGGIGDNEKSTTETPDSTNP